MCLLSFQQRAPAVVLRVARRTGRCSAVVRSVLALLVPGLSMAGWSAHARFEPATAELTALHSGQLLLRDTAQGQAAYRAALMHDSKVHVDIAGLVATVRLSQTFRNASGQHVEGVYGFPLPDEAAVRYMEMTVGERRIVGKVREREAARAQYTEARNAGKKVSLVEQQRPNLFTSRLANIAPGETVSVTLEYVQPVRFVGGVFSLRLPTTITPRYMPGLPLVSDGVPAEADALILDAYHGWAMPTDVVPDAQAISPYVQPVPGSDDAPLNPIEITATLDMGMPLASVESPYHALALSRRAGVYSMQLAAGVAEMNRDFVLNWQPVTGESPQAALFMEKVGDEYFGLLMLVPPSAPASATGAIAREMVFVVDTSGSMGGVAIEQARASLTRALAQLRPEDYFNVIAFNAHYRRLYPQPVPASSRNLQRARRFVGGLSASGGTEMLPALSAALAAGEPSAEDAARLRQVIFITDGAVGNETQLFSAISQQLGDTRLFTVGIGAAPNSWFMRRAAEFGRGIHTHIGDVGEVEQKMARLFAQLARPAGVNLTVQWPQAVETWPARMPDLYLGEPLSLAVNFGASPPAGEVLVRGNVAGREWHRRINLGETQALGSHAGVASLWARRKIGGLLDDLVTGRDEDEVRAEVLPLALRHQLLSPYTSFIAVEQRITRPAAEALHSTPVPNSPPQGQAPQHFAFPATATTGPARAWFALLALFLALLVHLVRGGEVDHAPRAGE